MAEPLVVFDNVVKRFGTFEAVKRMNFEIREGEFLAFNDERMNRDDSRNFGPLPEAAIAGKPLFIVHHGGESDQVSRVSMRVQPRETAASLPQTATPAPAK